jgi:TonB family protein
MTNFIKTTSKYALLLAVLACGWAFGQSIAQVPTNEAMARVVRKVAPTFPVAARQLNITGTQEVAIVVSAQGEVEEAKVLKGNAMFTMTSTTAAKQWKFTPYVKDGQPTKFATTLIFNYSK